MTFYAVTTQDKCVEQNEEWVDGTARFYYDEDFQTKERFQWRHSVVVFHQNKRRRNLSISKVVAKERRGA